MSKNVFQRINDVMKEVSYIQKGQLKKVAGQYTYASHDQVTAALREPLIKHGIAVIPSITEMTQNGNLCVVKVQVNFINIDDPKDMVSVTFAGHGIDTGDKGPGKAVSYACKYALLKTFCLETGDDPDHDQDVVHKEVHPANTAKPTKKSSEKSSMVIVSDTDIADFYEKHKQDKADLKAFVSIVKEQQKKTELDIVSALANDSTKMANFRNWQSSNKKPQV